MTQELEVEIESIAAGGDGVGRSGGLVVFVPRSAPGDVGIVRVTPKGSFARAAFRELRTLSPLRVEPPCEHYTRDRCGGCQLQHLDYEAQLQAKARIVRDAVQRIGKRDVALPAVHGSADQWRYRRKLTLALRRRGDRWIAGLHPFDEPSGIFALEDCPITNEEVLAVWRDVMAVSGDLPNARELRGAVRLHGPGASFVLEGGRDWPHSAVFFARVPSLSALWWQKDGGARRRLHKRESGLAPGASFAQVNADVAALLWRHVLDRVVARGPTTVVDAYAGLGDVAVALSERGMRVTAIELDADAAAWCGRRLAPGSRALHGRAEDLLPASLPADLVIVNPPRGGLDARVTMTLQDGPGRPAMIVYVSCNPATLARDLARMPAYRITSMLSFDMFPQTAHVETVCELMLEDA